MKHPTLWAIVISSFFVFRSASGHPADQSEMRVRSAPHELKVQLTFNVLTLVKFVRIDADGDGELAFEELKAAESSLVQYLNEHVKLEINQKEDRLGSKAEFEYLWPNEETTAPMPEMVYASRNVEVTFTQTLEPVLEDFWIGFEIFEETGPLQTIRGIFEQEGVIEEVPLSPQEPDYTYDTGFKVAPPVKAVEKRPTEVPVERRGWIIGLGILIVLIGTMWLLKSRPQKSEVSR